MNVVKFNIHNSREGVLTIQDNQLKCISDQEISNGDVLLHPQYSKVLDTGVATFTLANVIEERPSKGDWGNRTPSTWRRIEFKKEIIPHSVMKDLGHLRVEEQVVNGQKVAKAFLNF